MCRRPHLRRTHLRCQPLFKRLLDGQFVFIPSPLWVGGLCGALRLILVETPKARTTSNEGTRRSIRIAIASAILIIFVGLFLAIRNGLHFWLAGTTLIAGLAGGLFAIRHYVLRIIVWALRLGPLNYVAFLNYATARILLRRVGGGYVFIHRMLLDYLIAPCQSK